MFDNRLARGFFTGAVGAAAIVAGVQLARRSEDPQERARRRTMPKASFGDALSVAARVLIPTIAKGAIIRRPLAVGLSEALELDRGAIREMQRLRDKYWPGPLLFRYPIRPTKHMAVLLAPEHVHRVLDGTPEPFATASYEKRFALSHFQPEFSLISHGQEREDRVRWNDEVLDHKRAGHRMAESFFGMLDEAAASILNDSKERGRLDWEVFDDAWFRMVRRVVLGDGAADDRELTDMLVRLRRRGNWSLFAPVNQDLRRSFLARLKRHIERAEPGSIAELIARTPAGGNVSAEQQIPQWLFAFDPAGIATFRALALLAAHPAQARRAREEATGAAEGNRMHLPFLRACILDALRLWPTTPMVLRESTRKTQWESGRMPANTSILAFAQFFHRDDTRVPYAHRFEPDIWLDDGPVEEMMNLSADDWPLIPFSSGPGICSGRQLVLLLTSNMLGALVAEHDIRLEQPGRLDPTRDLPGTLNHFTLRFDVSPAGAHTRHHQAGQGASPRP